MSSWYSSRHNGVRFREHPTRKHGVKWDRYFTIRYQKDGKRIEEGLGWSSEGWTEQKAALKLAEFKQAAATGEGPQSLREKRRIEAEKRQRDEELRIQGERDTLTFETFFNDAYVPNAKVNKTIRSIETEKSFYKQWLEASIGDKPLPSITQIDLERIKKTMTEAGKAPRTIKGALALIRVVYNFAIRTGSYVGANPVSSVKLPRENNQRTRFLEFSEAEELLAKLKTCSRQTHDIALLSLHCGFRAGEVFNLNWGDVDLARGQVTVRDSKSGKGRVAFLTDRAKAVLQSRFDEQPPNELVFKDRKGKRIERVSKVFDRTVAGLKFNDNVEDRRQRVVFHTLRHTYASWLVENGTDLYTVSKLLGHGTISMTQRYSHLGEGTLKQAISKFEKGLLERADKDRTAEELA